MASIKFDNLKKSSTLINKDYTYCDLHYDIVMDSKNRDFVIDYDDQAIKNSLIRIFNTRPGERFLFPKFGCDLYRYLFMPITVNTAESIGNTILNAVRIWETRVTIQTPVTIVADPENHQYDIGLVVIFPKLRKQINLNGVLTQNGFKEV